MRSLRVVLVRPHFAGNLGAVARVMHNFGCSDLVLVAPHVPPDDVEARRWSCGGAFVLERARVVASLDEALAGSELSAATSAHTDGIVRRTGLYSLRELAPRLHPDSADRPIALVFGPEPHGLTTAEIDRCHYLVTIPTNPEYPSLNLAQAVAIALYEVSQTQSYKIARPQPASDEAIERALQHLRDGLTAIHFLYGEKADTLMHAVRHLIHRAQPSEVEVKILHGLARQMLWISQRCSTDTVQAEKGANQPAS